MALNVTCGNGHHYVQSDIYEGLPDGAPACPICFKEWAKENEYPVCDEEEFNKWKKNATRKSVTVSSNGLTRSDT